MLEEGKLVGTDGNQGTGLANPGVWSQSGFGEPGRWKPQRSGVAGPRASVQHGSAVPAP